MSDLELVSHLEVERPVAETKVLRGNPASEEDVDAFADREGHGHDTVGTRDTVEDADEVGEVVQHGEIVLDNNDVDGLGKGSVGVEGKIGVELWGERWTWEDGGVRK